MSVSLVKAQRINYVHPDRTGIYAGFTAAQLMTAVRYHNLKGWHIAEARAAAAAAIAS